MTASLRQIQSFVDHLRDTGAEEVELSKGGWVLKVRFAPGPTPSNWADMVQDLKARDIIDAGTDPSVSEEEKRAAERLIFASSS